MLQRLLLVSALCGGAFTLPLVTPSAAHADDPSLDQLLAQLDRLEQATDIAVAARRSADSKALADSHAGGGGGNPQAESAPPVSRIAQQPPQPLVPVAREGGLVTATASDPMDRMEQVLRELQLPTGGGSLTLDNGEQIFIAVSAPVSIGVRPGAPGYARSRQIAYNKADLLARAQVAEFMGVTMARERAAEIGVTDGVQAESLPEVANNMAQGLAEAQLEAELRAMGIDVDSYQNKSVEDKRQLLKDTYTQSFSSRATARLIGVTTLAITEGPIGDIPHMLVSVISSTALERMASMALDPRFVMRELPQGSKEAALSRLPLDSNLQLSRQFGAQMISDGRGNNYIVGFGHAEVSNPRMMAAAQRQAQAQAQQAIIGFVNETVSSEYKETMSETMRAFSDNSEQVEQNIESMQRIRGQSRLTLSGLETVATRRVNVDGRDTMVAVMLWSPNGRAAAELLRQRMQQAGRGQAHSPQAGGADQGQGEKAPSGPGHSTATEF